MAPEALGTASGRKAEAAAHARPQLDKCSFLGEGSGRRPR